MLSTHTHRLLLGAAAATVFATLPLPALAVLPFGSLVFTQPTGNVSPTEQVEVRMRYTVDPASVALDFSSNPLTGLDVADLPTQGQYYDPVTGQQVTSTFTSYTGAYLNTFFQCSGTFSPPCISGPDYTFTFWTSSEPGKPSINFLESFSLAPGQSTDYLFGVFDPVGSGASPGTYTFYNAGLTLNVRGLDADGNQLSADVTTLGQSCPTQDAGCAFTRTVIAIPEPGTYALMALGLAGLAWRTRRRR